MTQKNLMKTFYLLLLATSGAVWPWISAQAQQSCQTLNVIVTFSSSPVVGCTMQFTCPPANINCQSSTPITVTASSITCTSTTAPPNPNRSCTNLPNPTTYTYNSSTNTLVGNATFPRPNCNCFDPITLNSGNAYTATVSRCFGGNTVTSVFPGAPSQPVNVTGTYIIETPSSPNCPPSP